MENRGGGKKMKKDGNRMNTRRRTSPVSMKATVLGLCLLLLTTLGSTGALYHTTNIDELAITQDTADLSALFTVQRTTGVSIDPPTQEVYVGEAFSIDVYVEQDEPIRGVELKFAFDASLIHAESVIEGDLFAGHSTFFNPGIIDNETGTIVDVYGLIIGEGDVSEPGVFITISCTALDQVGVSVLDLYEVGIVTEGGYIPVTVTDGEVQVITLDNDPPYEPSDPDPYDGEIDVEIDHFLSWTGGDPNAGDTVTYDVYFGSTPSPPLVAPNVTETVFDPGTMDYLTTYYWHIVAWDNYDASTSGPEWFFTTRGAPEADLECDGELHWTDVDPGATVYGEFTVENAGDFGTLLDWEISDYPEWGHWYFDPSSGDDLTPEAGEIVIDVQVTAPDEEEEEFTGEINISNIENPEDFCIIAVSLATPVSQPQPWPHIPPIVREKMQEIYHVLHLVHIEDIG